MAQVAGQPGGTEAPRLTRAAFVSRSAALLAAIAAGRAMDETNTLTVTRHRVAVPGLDQPCRVAVLTDLHRSISVSRGFVAHAIDLANAERPDLVLVPGDFVTRSSHFAGSCAAEIARLRAPLGVFGCLGNHDYWCDGFRGAPAVCRTLRRSGIELLINASTRLPNGLRLIGIDDIGAGAPDLDAAFTGVPDRSPRVVMTHNPWLYEALRAWDCVSVAGHLHGGQINIPGVTQPMVGYPGQPLAGWWRDPRYPGRMYVSRGIGVVGLPLRLGAPPEIPVFDLQPA